MSYRFRKVRPDDAALLLEWRTRPDITRFMFTDLDHGSVDQQRAWIEACEGREDYRHFMALVDEKPVGYVSFGSIDWHNRHCVSGAYLGDLSVKAGIGAFWTWFIHDYAFYGMGMNKMLHVVMDGNEKVLRGHKVNGIRYVGTHRQHTFKYEQFHDVHLFEMLREEWDKRSRRPYTIEQSVGLFETY